MSDRHPSMTPEREAQIETIRKAAADAVREALRRHMLLGESVAVCGPDGCVRMLSPEDLRRILTAAW